MGRAIEGFNAEETKLFMEPFLGWRGWQWNADTKKLCSLNGVEWEPGEELHASCQQYESQHKAPDPDCNCGVFSMKDLGDLHRHVGRSNERSLVIGTIKVWGDVIVGSRGYRGEFAMIDSLYVPCSDAEQQKAELMKFMYDIEGIKTPGYLRSVMADDIESAYGVMVYRHDPRAELVIPEDYAILSHPYLGWETNGGEFIRRTMAIIAAAIVVTAPAVAIAPQEAQAKDLHLLRKIHHNVKRTHHFQDLMGKPRTEYHHFVENHPSCVRECKRGVLKIWRRHRKTAKRHYLHSPARICSGSTARCINAVFGTYGAAANRVASCESGHSIYARNGQYLGLFQMGDFARSRYGFAWNAYVQSVGAYHYFMDSGADWSPWQCKP